MLVLVVLAAAFWFYSERTGPPEPLVDETPVLRPEPIRYPVPEPRTPDPAPEDSDPIEPEPDEEEIVLRPERIPESQPEPLTLEASDPVIRSELARVLGEEVAQDWLAEERIIERTVLTAASLDSGPIPLRFRPMHHVPGLPRIGGEEGSPVLTGTPDPRYGPFREQLDQVDLDALAQIYFSHYDLFQQAWADMGHPDEYFNDRLVQVLDHLIATELPDYPVALVRPEVLYQFADEDLENESWGRKVLFRLGPEHAPAVQARLRELRELVTGG